MKSTTTPQCIASAIYANRSKWRSLFLLFSFLWISYSSSAQLQVQGRFLYNKCGQKVIIRGIEHMLYYQDQNQAMLPEIAKTGANSIRVMLDPALPAATLRQILQKCINDYKMYVSVAPWRGQDIWFRPEIKTVLQEFEDNIIIHAFGEAPYETTNDDARWISETSALIQRIRQAGYKAPLDIQSTTFGRDPRPVIRSGQAVLNADPLRNILFGVQLYWGDWYTGLYDMTIAEACQQFAALPYPVQVGACPSDCNTDCGNMAWDESFKNELGCMWWCWTGDEFELSTNGQFNQLTADGQYIINNSPYSMSKTSVRSIPCTAGDAVAPSVPSGLTSGNITQTSFTLSWNASTDNVAVTGYEVFRNGASIGTPTGTSFNVTGLTAGSTYSMTVRARDAVPNWSAQSAPLSVTTTNPAPVNLALNKPAFSSSNENSSLTPNLAVDGNLNTRWSSPFSSPQWIYVDLGAVYNLNRVVLRWEAAYGRAYQVQTSTNASTWTTRFSTTTGNGGLDDIAISGSGRYVRIYGTSRGTSWGYSLWELEVYGTSPTAKSANLITANEEGLIKEETAIYPNPVTSGELQVRITADKDEEATLVLLNAESQPVVQVRSKLTKGPNNVTLPVGKLSNGMYFLQVRRDGKQAVKKVIIEN
jgi:hypothetical protein